MGLQCLFAEASADLADRLVFFRVGVIASQQEGAIDICAFSLAKVCADDSKIEGVADTSEIIFL
jgi:hypothetical protein